MAVSLLELPVVNSGNDPAFLSKVETDAFRFFRDKTNIDNGLVPDSSRVGAPASIAAVGFGLTALCIGVENKWITKNEAYLLAHTTLKAFRDSIPHQRGFYYHFLDMKSGRRMWNCELSSVDTALFLAGALTAGEYFKGTEVEKMANEIYDRVDWPWMLNGKKFICMGWKPESGFLPYYWDSYSELMLIYALAIGSRTHPIAKSYWDSWTRPRGKYGNNEFVYCGTGSLFVYQYSHAWIDFRSMRDKYTDYWANSVKATLVNRQFCVDNMRKFMDFGPNMWGLTACIGPYGYKGYGGGPGRTECDGTLAPSAAAGSMPFIPGYCTAVLKNMHEKYGDKVYGEYGFKNAFNPTLDWFAKEYLAIDTGITLIMIENSRSGFVWKYFMRHPAIQKWAAQCMYKKKTATMN